DLPGPRSAFEQVISTGLPDEAAGHSFRSPTMTATAARRSAHSIRLSRAAGLLGFALGGFFDGILLHQVLQWHHLLATVQGALFQDLRVQILADGLFHALMYVIAV